MKIKPKTKSPTARPFEIHILHICHFQGLRGAHTYTIGDARSVLVTSDTPNGKTSFLNALAYLFYGTVGDERDTIIPPAKLIHVHEGTAREAVVTVEGKAYGKPVTVQAIVAAKPDGEIEERFFVLDADNRPISAATGDAPDARTRRAHFLRWIKASPFAGIGYKPDITLCNPPVMDMLMRPDIGDVTQEDVVAAAKEHLLMLTDFAAECQVDMTDVETLARMAQEGINRAEFEASSTRSILELYAGASLPEVKGKPATLDMLPQIEDQVRGLSERVYELEAEKTAFKNPDLKGFNPDAAQAKNAALEGEIMEKYALLEDARAVSEELSAKLKSLMDAASHNRVPSNALADLEYKHKLKIESLARLEPPAECPTCTDIWTPEKLKRARWKAECAYYESLALAVAAREKVQVSQSEAATVVKEIAKLKADSAQLEIMIAGLKAQSTKLRNQLRLHAAGGEGRALVAIENDLNKYGAALRRGRDVLSQLRAVARAQQLTREVKDAEKRLHFLRWVVATFGPDGTFKASLNADAVIDFVVEADSLAKPLGVSLYKGTDGVWVCSEHEPIPFALASRTERIVAGWALARRAGNMPFFAVDQAETLPADVRSELLSLLAEPATPFGLSVMAAAWTRAPLSPSEKKTYIERAGAMGVRVLFL